MQDIAYEIDDSLYLNITNRCTNQCPFCVRSKNDKFNDRHLLWLKKEPTAEEVLFEIGNYSQYKQIIFCGYGEPLMRIDTVKRITLAIKSKIQKTKINLSIRLNTNGQANLFWGRNILPELKGLIDMISISLNAQNEKVYEKLCHPSFGKQSYPAIIEFIKEAKKHIPQVEVSVVDLPAVDKAACRKIADKLGVSFRIRPYYESQYIR